MLSRFFFNCFYTFLLSSFLSVFPQFLVSPLAEANTVVSRCPTAQYLTPAVTWFAVARATHSQFDDARLSFFIHKHLLLFLSVIVVASVFH